MKQLVVGSRESRLALVQTHWVIARLEQAAPGLTCTVKTIKTQGDIILDVALEKIGDKGLFVKEIENALLQEEIDLAVHSMKDLPSALPPGLAIGAYTLREDPRDALISSGGNVKLAGLPEGAVIGTGSLRRTAQLTHFYPHLTFKPVRGNLDTRLKKLKSGEYDALVLALAGIRRLGLEELVAEIIPPGICLPAVGQGALGVEIRSADSRAAALVCALDHGPTRVAVTAERAFLHRLEGGCQVPLGALGEIAADGNLRLQGVIASVDGSRLLRDEETAPAGEAQSAGIRLAEKLLARGGAAILEEVRRACDGSEQLRK